MAWAARWSSYAASPRRRCVCVRAGGGEPSPDADVVGDTLFELIFEGGDALLKSLRRKHGNANATIRRKPEIPPMQTHLRTDTRTSRAEPRRT